MWLFIAICLSIDLSVPSRLDLRLCWALWYCSHVSTKLFPLTSSEIERGNNRLAGIHHEEEADGKPSCSQVLEEGRILTHSPQGHTDFCGEFTKKLWVLAASPALLVWGQILPTSPLYLILWSVISVCLRMKMFYSKGCESSDHNFIRF